jgi:phosphatidate cytidylyltransferase
VTTRVITGVVLAILAIVVIAHGGLLYFLLMLALGLIGISEFFRLAKSYKPLSLAGLIGVILILYMAWFHTTVGLLGAIALCFALVGLLGLVVGARPGVTARMAVTMLGVLYVGLGFGSLLLMRRLDVGTGAVLTVVFGTWAGDTMAYFTGKFFGATPMAPRLSPKKTWEGFVGGAISTVLIVVFIGLYTELGPANSLLVGVVIAIVGPLGDLFESLVKRDVQIKDSGRGIPGHGGVLDRFDALLWSSVAAYFVLTVVLKY